MAEKKIKRALISVYDKKGVVDFARTLVDEFGIEVISTGGTAGLLKESGVPVTLVEEVTGFPEMMDGRVKTLHPKIHAGILADRDNPDHMRQLKEQGIEPIDMVVVNLYPFQETVADPDCKFEQAIEMIDIGGPCLLRAAAKNHKHVLVVDDAEAYSEVLRVLRGEWDEHELNVRYASGVFGVTSCYDGDVASWLGESPALAPWPSFYPLNLFSWGGLRYGENPHQQAQLLESIECMESDAVEPDLIVADAQSPDDEQAQMSLNNYADANSALELCKELTRGFCAPEIQGGTEDECGTGFQPVQISGPAKNLEPLADERHTRRNLPHIQTPGKTYFTTFRLKEQATLSPDERDLVLEACRFWDGQRIDLHAAVVMPDHVHLLLTPMEVKPGTWVSLSEVLHSVKRYSARRINEDRGASGPLWQDESFDRIMRNEREYRETLDYIANNPLKKELDEDGHYRWWWDEEVHGGEAHRLKAGATQEGLPDCTQQGIPGGTHEVAPPDTQQRAQHRLKTGATLDVGLHRQDAGATQSASSTCVFIKHTNACGVGLADDPAEAYRQAYLGDPNAAMGGVLACNFDVGAEFAKTVMETFQRWGKEAGAGGFFVEVWIAPSFSDDAVEFIRTTKKWGKRVRLLSVDNMGEAIDETALQYKTITGGMLVQTRDVVGLNEDQWKVVTKRKPTDAEMADLRLAWLVCKHTKSNAITVCKDNMLIGNGAGQMSRVMSCRIATWLAKENGHEDKLAGAVGASDAFFPFRDGPDILMDAGATAIIQPGGSKRDADTIAACDERNVAMIFTGTRHFRH